VVERGADEMMDRYAAVEQSEFRCSFHLQQRWEAADVEEGGDGVETRSGHSDRGQLQDAHQQV
jgi:hypothetical protein